MLGGWLKGQTIVLPRVWAKNRHLDKMRLSLKFSSVCSEMDAMQEKHQEEISDLRTQLQVGTWCLIGREVNPFSRSESILELIVGEG